MSDKKSYFVTIPFAGAVSVAVEAYDEKGAIEEAFDRAPNIELSENDDTELVEFEYHMKISQGNVLYARFNEVEVEEQ
jgi:hypothetical protein